MESQLAAHHQIHGVQPVLPVPDVADAVRWFCRVLGFQIDFEIGEPVVSYARVRLGDRSFGDPIYIHLRPQGAGDQQPCGETRLHAGNDIDGLHAHVLAQGGDVIAPPADQPWGLREFTLRAPGGHRFVMGAEVGAQDGAKAALDGPRTVIVTYRANPGQEAALLAHIRRHVPTLQRLGLATMRAPFVMRGGGGVLLEVFEWASVAASRRAHHEAEVQAMWARFAELCSFEALASLPEAAEPFAHFEAL